MNKICNLGLISLMVILMIELVSAAYDCDMISTATTAGTSNTYKRGATVNISANVTGRNSAVNAYNLTTAVITINTGTISGALTQNDTAAPIGNLSDFDDLNFTVDTKALKDDTTYTLTITLKNETQQTEGTCTLSIITDNTAPVSTVTTPATNSVDTDGVIPFSYTCANASSATLFIETKPFTMSESSDVCTYTNALTSKLTNGFQSIYITASDGLNTTSSATTKFEVRKPGSSGSAEGATVVQTRGGAIAGKSPLVWIGALVALYLIFGKDKGKRRR